MSAATVLISSAGRRGALVRALQADSGAGALIGRVIATDMSWLSSAGHLADALFQVPACSDAAFIPRLEEICDFEAVTLIVPTIDTELLPLAQHRDRFAARGTQVLVSSPETIAIAADKQASSRWLESHGFPVPTQYPISEALAGDYGWPLFFKPLRGSSSIGASRVDSADDLRHSAGLYEGVVEELVVGDEYTVDVYVDMSGIARCAVPRLRLETRAGEVSKGMTVRHSAIETLSAEVATALPGAWGPITIQMIDAADGPRVIEINPRLGGGYPLSSEAGVRFVEAAVVEPLGRPIPSEFLDWKPDVVMLRYDDAVFVDRSSAGL